MSTPVYPDRIPGWLPALKPDYQYYTQVNSGLLVKKVLDNQLRAAVQVAKRFETCIFFEIG
jgi:hypothetical protein